MLVFFTNCLGVIEYAELKKLFYQKLYEKVSQSAKLPPAIRGRYCRQLCKDSLEMDCYNLQRDFKMDYQDVASWLAAVCSELRSSVMLNHLKSLMKRHIEDELLTVGIAFTLTVSSYAATLLRKGSLVICNHAFAFNHQQVLSALKNNVCKDVLSPVKELPLYLHMEYFYFDGITAQTSPETLKNNFIARYFKALNTYRKVLQQDDIEAAFKIFL